MGFMHLKIKIKEKFKLKTKLTKAGVKLTNIVGPTMWADKS